ncbi:MAG: FAD:protein FMN transferase [Planctomycetes bacterium]|nr:FAD:protein FMN transferase [Planctomycetota bacterium]
MERLHRRRWLCAAMGGGASLGLFAAASRFRARDTGNAGVSVATLPDGSRRVTRTGWAFGTEISITAIHPCETTAVRAIAGAFRQVETVDEVMSLHRTASQLCVLNRDQVLWDPHPFLLSVMNTSRTLSQRTDGAFDVTVQPLWVVHDEAMRRGEHPGEVEIAAARRKVDWRQIEIGADAIRLHGGGQSVTLNGIAQGFAADRAMEALRREGIDHAIVDSGEIATLGRKTATEAWSIGVRHPRRKDAFAALIRLDSRALATSGDYATAFDPNFREHHIFDPRTGRSPGQLSSVTVAASTSTEADALSTAVFVLGIERGLRLVRSTPGADALLILKDGGTVATEGFPAPV